MQHVACMRCLRHLDLPGLFIKDARLQHLRRLPLLSLDLTHCYSISPAGRRQFDHVPLLRLPRDKSGSEEA